MIDHDAAEKLRTMLSDIQQKAMSHPDVEPVLAAVRTRV
jgi:hypothetical protein